MATLTPFAYDPLFHVVSCDCKLWMFVVEDGNAVSLHMDDLMPDDPVPPDDQVKLLSAGIVEEVFVGLRNLESYMKVSIVNLE